MTHGPTESLRAPLETPSLEAPPRLVGEFVILRALTCDDAPITHRWRLGARARHLNGAAASLEDQARWIASRPTGEFNYMIELVGGPAIGMLSLVNIDLSNRRAESARFLIGDEAAAQGAPAAVEAMKLLYELAFERLGLERIYGLVEERNHLMLKWQKYLGMKEEGRLRRHFFMDGEFVDAVSLGLLAEEYRATSLPRMRSLIALGRPRATGA
ncbi:GNAT family protein [Phenylobacterium sp.]|jgi:diamine N-acetyltransferase|uniref:GNAT family N-acetyltransferase n=1 Tax=Phenylobacterium sp. TaxID=1871053 RepID=UPI002F3E49D7